ncbi:MAG: TOBE domain-containing protein [Pseudohongiellaceae bacterium]
MKKIDKAHLTNEVSFQSAGQANFSEKEIALLIAIEKTGSITAAAKEVGISYKTAWDRVDKLNNLSEQAIVSRSAGGAKGGGTVLTKLGQSILEGFLKFKKEQESLLEPINSEVSSIADFAAFSSRTRIKSSARNQFGGTVSKIQQGEVTTEVEVSLGDNLKIVATITNESQQDMKLAINNPATALIKASWILLSNDLSIATSARNNISGTVLRVTKGGVNSEVVLDIGHEKTLCATVTNQSANALGIEEGKTLLAFFKASSVILINS